MRELQRLDEQLEKISEKHCMGDVEERERRDLVVI